MASSGTYNYLASNTDIIEEACELAGFQARTAEDASSARRTLSLILDEWANYGVNIWTLENVTTAMTETATLSLTARTIDVLAAVLQKSSTEHVPMERISIEEYHQFPNKQVQGSPSQYALVRTPTAVTVYLYPVPDIPSGDTWLFNAWQFRYMADVGTAIQNPDIPRRFAMALIYQLAAALVLKRASQTLDVEMARSMDARAGALQARGDAIFEKAREQDSDAASLYLRPGRRGR